MPLNDYVKLCHEANRSYWYDKDNKPIRHNKGQLLMNIVQDIASAWEAEQYGLASSYIPEHRKAEVKMVEGLIHIFEYAYANKFDLDVTLNALLERRKKPNG